MPDEEKSESKDIKDAFAKISVDDARGLFTVVWSQEDTNRRKYTQLHRQLEGGKPYDQDDLDNEGQGHRSNHNFRDAEAERNRAGLPYWELVNTQVHRATVVMEKKTAQKEQYEQAFMTVMDDFFDDWGVDYIVSQEMTVREYINFGKTFVTWKGESPRYKSHMIQNVLFPSRTPLSPAKWSLFYLKDEVGFDELWELVRTEEDEAAAETLGWNIEMVKTVLAQAVDMGKDTQGVVEANLTNRNQDQWDDIRNEILNNELTATFGHPAVSLITLYKKETDGKISIRIFLEDKLVNDDKDLKAKPMDDYLFKNTDESESFSAMVGVNYWEVANGMIGGVKGFAERNFNMIILRNRMKNTMVDSLDLSSALNFKRIGESSDDEPVIENYGNINVISPTLEAINHFPNSNEALKIMQSLVSDNDQNNAIYRDQTDQIADTGTAKQAQLLANIQSQVSRANATLYLAYHGDWLTQCMNKLRKRGSKDLDAVKFVERLEDLGVPPEVIHDTPLRVFASGSPQMASPAAREAILQELLALANAQGVRGREIIKDFIVNKVGIRNLERYMPADPQNSNAGPTGYATIEEAIMATGINLPVDQSHDHVVHLENHMTTLENIVNKFLESGEVDGPQTISANFIRPHVEAHLQFLSQDQIREDQFKVISKRYNQIRQRLLQMLNQADQELKGEQANAA